MNGVTNNLLSSLNKFFNKNPGSHEFYLQKRLNNPFISNEHINISVDDIRKSQQDDRFIAEEFEIDLVSLITEISNLKANEESDTLLLLKTKLDNLYHRCSRLGGNQVEHKKAIISLINSMMKSIWLVAKGDQLAEEELRDEEIARELHFDLLESHLIAEIIADDSVILEKELVPLVLYETTTTVTQLFNLFTPEQQNEFLHASQDFLQDVDSISSEQLTFMTSNYDLMSAILKHSV